VLTDSRGSSSARLVAGAGAARRVPVMSVEPSGPPASLDDVREAVVEGVRRSKAFELAGEQAQALAEAARGGGLPQAVADAKELSHFNLYRRPVSAAAARHSTAQ